MPNYLSDLRPNFKACAVEVGCIPGYRFDGNLRSEIESGALDAGTAIALLG